MASETDRVANLGHNQLSTFGLLNEHGESQVKSWIGQLVGEGLLEQTADEFPVLKLNAASWQMMRGQQDVRLTRSGSTAATRRSRAEEISWEGVNTQIFDALRTWRREVASRKGMAPFTIFHDSTLREISRVRPTTLPGLHMISGVGEGKLREHGEAVLEIVGRLSRQLELSTDNVTPIAASPISARPAPSTADIAFPLFREAQVACRNRPHSRSGGESTIAEYLCEFLATECPDNIDAWVDRESQQRIRVAAKEDGTQRLKPIFLALNQELPYEAIRIVLAFLNTSPNR